MNVISIYNFNFIQQGQIGYREICKIGKISAIMTKGENVMDNSSKKFLQKILYNSSKVFIGLKLKK